MASPLPTSLYESLAHGGPLMSLMGTISVVTLALAMAKVWQIVRFRSSLRRADAWVLGAMRKGDLRLARQDCEKLSGGLGKVFAAGLDRALGAVKGEPAMGMRREEKRAMGGLRSLVWVLGSTGALMPFVGLLGTVLGVMASFHAIGESAASGFDVVASGISEALIATAAGLFVALEAIICYNVLQNLVASQGRELGLLTDEALELLKVAAAERAAGEGAP